jgi:phenylalanyl-tRNA synthetase beta chain
MKLPIGWLREYLDFSCPLDELADALTMAGLEVEEIAQVEGDTVLDVKVTPNRGDWLSVIGVAREAAPLVGSKARMPEPKVDGSGPQSSELIKIDIEDPDLCGRYVGVVVRGVEIKPSPEWMRDRLAAAGMRPINNIVDITNYVMLELGQPLHAFDLKLLREARIIVRRARAGEKIISLDGSERELSQDMLVIADSEHPVAIAGVMGGLDSEIGEQTQDILVESANFTSTSIRRTCKRLGMVTESSYRFERGVDPSITATAALRAAELMCELAGGEVARGIVDVRPRPVEPRVVEARPSRVNSVLGTEIAAESMVEHLNGLEIETTLKNGVLVSRVPTFRQDITREIDLVEEIGRAYGYQNLPMTLPKARQQGKDSRDGQFRDKLRRILMSCGGQEVLTHSLVDSKLSELAGRCGQCIKLRNPLSEDLDSMRTVLIPNLLGVIQRNQSFGTNDVCIFEIGKVYFRTSDGELDERLAIAGAMTGSMWRSAWGLPANALESDFFLCKGAVESLLDGLGIGSAEYVEVSDPVLHPTRAAKVLVGGKEIGIVGEVSPKAMETLDVRGRALAYELDFEALMNCVPEVLKYRQLPRYPALHRHLAVVVSDDTNYEQLARIIAESGKGFIEQVELLDVYKGEQVGEGRSSLTMSMVFRSREKTLTDEQVNSVLDEVKEALARSLGACFR